VAEAAVVGSLVDPGSPSGEPFRSLRLTLQLRREDRAPSALLFTSPDPGDGKSTIAANFALVSSLGHSDVLLVDADLRQPTLHGFFGLPRTNGLVESLAARGSFETRTHRVGGLGNLEVLTAGAPVARPSDVLASTQLGELLDRALESFGTVVIDSPPLLKVADAASIAAFPNVEVVLVASRKTRRRSLAKAVRQLELIDARIAGVVLNREGRLSHYGY
jgi:capsular exopolysaccharide synthesis family protein